ncbi:MAG: N-acetylglucosamine-6-phosphate deacetylase [Candidatus Dormibacteraeota bacterium]|nr:N-acetylglucosamine-6-phosphate deacetylase [Candidatus Dormibacteraeota bacterium]
MPTISAQRIVSEGRLLQPGAVVIEGGHIVAVREGRPPASEADVHLEEGVLGPGLIDLQLNGMVGVDFGAAPAEDWRRVQEALPSTGVTAFLPTLITAPLDSLAAGLESAAAAREAANGQPVARILGVHLEGPFLSPERRGAHDPAWLLEPTPEHVDRLLGVDGDILALITLAPELEGGLEAIRRLSQRGVVVSIGHSNATAGQMAAGVDAGARMVTHLFNAQRGLHHREPGVVGQALVEPRLTLGLIVDLSHVVAPVCKLVFAAASGRVALVSDATAAAGQPPGRYELGGEIIETGPSGPPRRLDGTLAGAVLRMDEAVANVVGLGVDLAVAIDAASRIPADVLGRADLGRLAPDAVADLVWLDDDLHTRAAWIGGALAFGEVDW